MNFGHTFAHALEKNTDLLHGEAVSIGMILASKLSEKLGFLQDHSRERIENLLKNIRLPLKIHIDAGHVLEAIKLDKKREGDSIHLILLKKIGEAFIHKVKLNTLEDMINDMRGIF